MKLIEIEALDTLFFRDGKPFTMGEDSFAGSIFPPFPSVLYGFLRALCLAARSNGSMADVNTEKDPTRNLKTLLVALKLESGNPLFPMPADLAVVKGAGNKIPAFFAMEKASGTSGNQLNMILKAADNGKLLDSGGLYLSGSALANYLKGNAPVEEVYDISEYLSKEPKIGIGRDNATHTANDSGRLYQLLMQRPEGRWEKGITKGRITILVGYEGIELNSKAIGRLGGEGKMAYYHEIDNCVDLPAPVNSTFAKMYLSTPAIFSDGWFPERLFKAYGVSLEAACVGRYQSIGGWDMAKSKPKKMFRAVPAGSVYYLKGEGLDQFIRDFHGKELSGEGIPPEYSNQGFGIVYFGNCQDVNEKIES